MLHIADGILSVWRLHICGNQLVSVKAVGFAPRPAYAFSRRRYYTPG
jgi:hypothetical protein